MKKLILISIIIISLTSCKHFDSPIDTPINLGIPSATTAINKITQNDNSLTIQFGTTTGSKYSLQVIGFGQTIPSIVDGFTADNSIVIKKYDLSNLSKINYDIVFIDINGHEIKIPIVVN